MGKHILEDGLKTINGNSLLGDGDIKLQTEDNSKLPRDGSQPMLKTLALAKGTDIDPSLIIPQGNLTKTLKEGAIERDSVGNLYSTTQGVRSRIMTIKEVNELPKEVPNTFEIIYLKKENAFYIADGKVWSALVKSSVPIVGGNPSMVIRDIRQVTTDEYAALPMSEKGTNTLYISKGSPYNIIAIPPPPAPPENPPILNIEDLDLNGKIEFIAVEAKYGADATVSNKSFFNFRYHNGDQDVIVRIYDYDPITDKETFVVEYLGRGVINWWMGEKAGTKRIKYMLDPNSVKEIRSEFNYLSSLKLFNNVQEFTSINLPSKSDVNSYVFEKLIKFTGVGTEKNKVYDFSCFPELQIMYTYWYSFKNKWQPGVYDFSKNHKLVNFGTDGGGGDAYCISLEGNGIYHFSFSKKVQRVHLTGYAKIEQLTFESCEDFVHLQLYSGLEVNMADLVKLIKQIDEAGRYNGTISISKEHIVPGTVRDNIQNLRKRGWSISGITVGT